MVQPEVITAAAAEHAQRVQCEIENLPSGKRVKIRLESYDEKLGWYSSGALCLPLHQLPLLEQAIGEMRSVPAEPEFADIIPFPGCEQAA